MRIACVLLIGLLAGCGSGAGNRSQDPHAAFAVFPPSIVALLPSSVPVNSAPFTMTINGSNFGTDAVVSWNGTLQQTTFINSTQLMVLITDTDLMFVGLAHVLVRTAGMNSNTLDFDVTAQ